MSKVYTFGEHIGELNMYTLYEIYTKNAVTGEGGWTIEFVWAMSRESVARHPLFDAVIGVENETSDPIEVLRSGHAMCSDVATAIYS